MEKDLISIVVPFYNAAEYLHRCLFSLTNQTYLNLEIIMINDMSVDESSAICKTYQTVDKRIKIYERCLQGGPAAARNDGIHIAEGKYVYFMDADDELDLSAIELLHAKYIEHNPDLVIGNTKRISLYKVTESDWNREECFFATRKEIVNLVTDFMDDVKSNKVFWSAWGKLYRMDIIKNNKLFFSEKVIVYEDVLFVINYLMHVDSLYFINKALYTYYHYGQKNIASNRSYIGYMDFKYTVKAAKEILETDKDIKKETVKKLYGNAYSEYAIWSMFNVCYRVKVKNLLLLLSTIFRIVNEKEFQNNLIYYTQKHNDNFKTIPWMSKHRLTLLVVISFKIQIFWAKLKMRR